MQGFKAYGGLEKSRNPGHRRPRERTWERDTRIANSRGISSQEQLLDGRPVFRFWRLAGACQFGTAWAGLRLSPIHSCKPTPPAEV